MPRLSPSLLALIALAPAAAALEVADSDVKLGLVLQLQVRAERGWASDTAGKPYNVAESAADTRPDTADFYLRRFRIGFAGSYKDDYRFRAVLRMDSADRTGDTAPTAAAGGGAASATSGDPLNRVAQINQAFVERIFRGETVDQSVRAGLDYAFFNGTAAVFPGNTYLFPSDRATSSQAFLDPRGVGVGYKMMGKISGKPFTWGIDVQNNQSDDSASATGNTGTASYNQKGEGLCYTTRFQMVAFDSEAKGHMKPVESFIGAPGTGVFVSVEAGMNRNNNASTTTRTNLKAEGAEILVHHDQLTALAEIRFAQLATDASTPGATTNTAGRIYLVQAGYAMPTGATWVEPALRFTRINVDQSNPEPSNYGTMTSSGCDYGSSGFQTELGVNWYLNAYNNKLACSFQNWRGEGGTDHPATANIARVQWNLFF